MGGKVSVIGKANKQSNENKFIELYKERKLYNLSINFAYFLDSQYYDISPFKQIQSILETDLTFLISVPEILFSPKIEEIEYKIRYDKTESINELEQKLNLEKERIKKQSEETLKGWTLISELIELTESLWSKFMESDDLGSKIEDAYNGFDNDYFSKKSPKNLYELRFVDDLEMVIRQLKCYKEAVYNYACLLLYGGNFEGPLASFINKYDEKYKWKILG